jgi:hypothetical protein
MGSMAAATRQSAASGPPPRVSRQWPRSLAAFLALAGIAALTSAAFWPGHMSIDTIGELEDARRAHYTDWHSATMTALWHVLFAVGLGNPGWVLAGSLMTMLVGLYLIVRLRLSRPAAAVVAVLVFLFPPILGYSVLIGTDAWFTSLVLCGFGLAARTTRTRGASRTVSAVLAVACGALAQTARPTAAPAVLALLCAVALVILAPRLRGWRHVLGATGAGLVATALIVGSVQGADRFVLHAAQVHPEQETYEYDLVGMSIYERKVLLPIEIYPRHDLAYLEKLSKPSGIALLFWGGFAAIPPAIEGPPLDSLQQAWLTAIRQQPQVYLRVRMDDAMWQLTVRNDANFVNQTPPQPPGSGYSPALPALHSRILAYLVVGATSDADGNLRGGPLHRVWVYILLLFIVMVAGPVMRSQAGAILSLLAAALLTYSAVILLFSPGVTFRYMYPAVTTGTVLFIVLVVAAGQALRARLMVNARSGAQRSASSVVSQQRAAWARGPMLDLAAIVSALKRIVRSILRPFARPLLRRIDALARRVDEVEYLAVRMDRHLPLVENAIKSQNSELRGVARERAQIRADLERLRTDLEYTQQHVQALRAASAAESTVAAPAPAASVAPPLIPDLTTWVEAERRELRLNFHCGVSDAPDHIDVDLRDWKGEDIAGRVRRLAFDPSSAVEVRASLALERFSTAELRADVLPYWRSLLAPGGTLVVISLDAGANLADHQAGRLSFDELAAISFGSSESESTARRSMLSEDLLSRLLDEAGFVSVHTAARWRAEDASNRIEVRARREEAERTPDEVNSRSRSRA